MKNDNLLTWQIIENCLDEFYLLKIKQWKFDCINPMNKKDFDYNLYNLLDFLQIKGEFKKEFDLFKLDVNNIYYSVKL